MSLIALLSPSANGSRTSLGQAAAEPVQPATAFADLLDKPDENKTPVKKVPQHPVYSFAELGMFGLHAVQPATGAAAKVEPASKPVSHASPTAQVPQGGRLPMAALSGSSQPLISVPFLYGDLSADIVHLGGPAVVAEKFAAIDPAAMRVAVKAGAAAKSPDMRAAPQMPTAAKMAQARAVRSDAGDIAVTVSGPKDALQIAVRSNSQPSPEVMKLRRLIEATVAHFEMDIAELHFNGTSIGTAFSLGGGMNGGSAR